MRRSVGAGRGPFWRAVMLAAFLAFGVGSTSIGISARQQAERPVAAQEAQPSGEHAEEGSSLLQVAAKLFNFAVLAGVLVYFLRSPAAEYFATRGKQIREDLVAAAAMRATATAQLAEIEERLRSLPAELEALRLRGAEDLRAERGRIAEAAAGERDRVLEQTRREIEMRLRIARRELTALAATLAVDVAEKTIKRAITPDDHLRLVERYTSQLREAR